MALVDVPLSTTGEELLARIREACNVTEGFMELSAIGTGFWPLILTACRHYRLPIPPQMWIDLVLERPPSSPHERSDMRG